MEKSLEQTLLEEIEKTGFPTELKVEKCFVKSDWNASLNLYYLDKDERKGREIDLAAYANNSSEKKSIRIGIHIIGEVKKLDKPWIIFSTELKYNDFLHGYARMHYANNCNLQDFLTTKEIEQESGFCIYKKVGKSYWEAFKKEDKEDKQSVIFSSLTRVIKASEYILEKNEEAAKKVSKGQKAIEFFEPVIILDGKLFEAFLDVQEKIKINEINRALVSFDYKSPAYKRFRYGVQIINFSELPNYIAEKEAWLKSLSTIANNKKQVANIMGGLS